MATIDQLQVEITAITKDFNRQMDGVKGKLSELEGAGTNAGEKINNGLSKVGAAGALALKVGIVGAIAAITASIPAAVKRIDTLNNAPKVLQNLGYSAADSEKAIQLLSKGIQGLPTRMDDAATALTAIAAASGRGVLEAKDLTLAFNNMALAGGKGPAEAQRALVQFTQAIGRGKMGMQEFNTLSEVMPAQLTQIAKSLLGPTANAATLRDALGEGTLSMDQFMNEIVRLDKEGGPGFASFSKQAVDATAGIGTGFENMKTAITRGLVAVMDAVGSENIANAISGIGKAFEGALKKVAEFITFLLENKEVLTPFVETVSGAFKGIMDSINRAWDTLRPFVEWLVANLLPPLQGIAEYVAGQFKEAWDSLVTAFEKARPILEFLAKVLGVALIIAIGLFVGAIVAVIVILSTLINWIAKAMDWFWGLYAAIAAGIMWVVDKSVEFYNGITKWFGDAWQTIKNIWGEITAFFGGLFGNVSAKTTSLTEQIKNTFTNAWNVVRGVWSAVAGFFSGVVGAIMGAISGVPGAFGNIFRSAWNQVTSIFGNIGGWFSGLAGQMVQAGRNMIAGLVSGLNPGPVIERMKSIASSAVNTVKSFLGIKSPSRVMRDQVGKMMGAGMAEGIELSTKNAVKSASDSAKQVLSAYDGAFNTQLPSPGELSSKLDMSMNMSAKLSDIDGRPVHVTVMVGEDTLVDKVINGINNQSFMSNNTVIRV